MEKTYDHVNKKPQWFNPVQLSKISADTGVYVSVVFMNEPIQCPEYNARLSKQQINTLRCSATVLRTQRTLDESRDKIFRLLCCEQPITIVPHQLEQDTAPIGVNQTRLSCYCLVLDIITKAMEKIYGIQI